MSVETPAQTPAPEGQIGEKSVSVGEIKVNRNIKLVLDENKSLVGVEVNVSLKREIKYGEAIINVEYSDRQYIRPYTLSNESRSKIDEFLIELYKYLEEDLLDRVNEKTALILKILSLRSIIPIEVVEG